MEKIVYLQPNIKNSIVLFFCWKKIMFYCFLCFDKNDTLWPLFFVHISLGVIVCPQSSTGSKRNIDPREIGPSQPLLTTKKTIFSLKKKKILCFSTWINLKNWKKKMWQSGCYILWSHYYHQRVPEDKKGKLGDLLMGVNLYPIKRTFNTETDDYRQIKNQ